MKTSECLDCYGRGEIVGFINGEEADRWECPSCNGSGEVSHKEHAMQANCRDAFHAEQVKYGGSPK